MEMSDEVGGDEIDELFALVPKLEEQIQNFTFVGEGVTGNIETGFIVDREDDNAD